MTRSDPVAGPISRTTLSGQVTERLRDGILAGLYRQGEQLNEAELARRFGVSRGPLREAMQRLIQDGLLENRPHRGVFVPKLTDEDLADIFIAREAIETAALRLVMAAGDSVSVSRRLTIEVDRLVDALRRDDWNDVVDHEMRFHTELVDSANSRRLSRMYSALIAETRLCLHLPVSGFTERKYFVEEHVALVERLAAEDATGAQRAIRKHLHKPPKSLARRRRDRTGAPAAQPLE